MCTVSYIGDYWGKRVSNNYPWVEPYVVPYPYPADKNIMINSAGLGVSVEEFNQLKKEVEELKKLLQAAIKFDKETNQPHCEQEEKIAMIKKIAELVGVDLNDVFGKE